MYLVLGGVLSPGVYLVPRGLYLVPGGVLSPGGCLPRGSLPGGVSAQGGLPGGVCPGTPPCEQNS